MQNNASVMSLPNLLTMARIALIPVIAVLLLADFGAARWIAFALYVAAAITDWFDGYLARRDGLVSPLGRMLDPIADKLLVCVLIVLFAFDGTFSMTDLLPALTILGREVFISGLREFLGNQSVVMNVSRLAKYKTTVQLIAIGALMLAPMFPAVGLAGRALFWIAAVLTVWTGYEYLRGAAPHLKGDAA